MKLKEPTPVCKVCFREFERSNLHGMITRAVICPKCLDDLAPSWTSFQLDGVNGTAIYLYHDKIRNLIFQYKGCKDYELKDIFFMPFERELNLLFGNFVLLIVPSSKEHVEERGFDHVYEMVKGLKMEKLQIIYKNKIYKQSDQNLEKRAEIKGILEIKDGNLLKNKRVLLVDDICTTGATLKACIDLVKPFEPKQIKILVLAKRTL